MHDASPFLRALSLLTFPAKIVLNLPVASRFACGQQLDGVPPSIPTLGGAMAQT